MMFTSPPDWLNWPFANLKMEKRMPKAKNPQDWIDEGLERAARYLEDANGPGLSERRRHTAAIRELKGKQDAD